MRKYNRLTITKNIGIIISPKGTKRYFVTAVCECGTIKDYRLSHLTSGATKSCGCFSKENMKKIKTSHGMYGTRLYKIWSNMKNRCSNPKYLKYKDYGGKGITVCKKWQNFESFLTDMGSDYSELLTLDRIDNSKGYKKTNCRWVSMKEQQRNRSNNTLWTLGKETKTAAQWAEDIGINYGTLLSRVHNSKWSIEKALTTPVLK